MSGLFKRCLTDASFFSPKGEGKQDLNPKAALEVMKKEAAAAGAGALEPTRTRRCRMKKETHEYFNQLFY